MVKGQKRLTIITNVIIFLTLVLLTINGIDFKAKEKKGFLGIVADGLSLRSEVVYNYLNNSITRIKDDLELIAQEYVTSKDITILNNYKNIGSLKIVDYSSLNIEYKEKFDNNEFNFITDDFPIVILVPIIENDQLIGVLVNENINLDAFLGKFIPVENDKLIVVGKQGNYVFNKITTNDVITDLKNIEVYDKKINDISDYIKNKDIGLLSVKTDGKYYFHFRNYNGLTIILLSDATHVDFGISNLESVTLSFLIKTILIISVFFIYLLTYLTFRHKQFKKKSLQIESLSNLKEGTIVLVKTSENYKFLYKNKGLNNLIGFSDQEIESNFKNSLLNLIYRDDLEQFNEEIKNVIDGLHNEFSIRMASKNGSVKWVHLYLTYSKNQDTCTIVMLDITESKAVNTEIKNLVATIPGAVLKMRAESLEFSFVSDSFYTMLGYKKSDFKNNVKSFLDLVYLEDKQLLLNEIDKNEDLLLLQLRLVKKDGNVFWASINCRKVNEYSLVHYHTVLMDISNQIKTLQDLNKEIQRTSIFFEMSDEFILEYIVNEDKLIATKKCIDEFGFPKEINGFYTNIRDMNKIHQDDVVILTELVGDIKNIRSTYNADIRIMCLNGNYSWFNLKCVTLYEEGKPYKVIAKLVNIDEQKRRLDTLIDISKRDSLTKLLNSTSYSIQVKEYLTNKGHAGNHMFLVFDIDDFKGINDKYGHAYGNEIIKNYANRLNTFFGEENLIARIGGDEFCVLIKNTNPSRGRIVMSELMTTLSLPITVDDVSIFVSSSFGASFYPFDGETYDDLFVKADLACYYSKYLGSNQVSFYDKSMQPENGDYKNISYRVSKVDSILYTTIALVGKKQTINGLSKEVMTKICEYFDFDFAYLFEGEDDNFQCTMSFDQTSKVIMEGLIDIHNPASTAFSNKIRKDSILYINDIDILKDDLSDLYLTMKRESTRSVIICGLFSDGVLNGLVCFGSHNMLPYPTQQEIAILLTSLNLFASQVRKIRRNIITSIESRIFKTISNNQNLHAYAINENYDLLYASNNMSNDHSDIFIGSKCYFSLYGRNSICPDCPIKFLGNKDFYSTYQHLENQRKWVGISVTNFELELENTPAKLLYYVNISDYIDKLSVNDKPNG